MKRILCAMLAVLMVFGALAGCNKTETPSVDISGTYNAVSCTLDGDEYECDGEYIELNADGTGVISFNGGLYSLTWMLDGSSFSFTDSDNDSLTNGLYSKGVITGEYLGYTYRFELEGTQSSAKAAVSAAEETGETEETVETPAESATTTQSAGEFSPVTIEADDGIYTLLGAELITDADGEDGIRLFFEYVNTSDLPDWESELTVVLNQEGFELKSTWCLSEDDAPEYGNTYRTILPGLSIVYVEEYKCKADGDVITVSMTDWWNDTTEEVVLDPQNLPGRPDVWEPDPISEPWYIVGAPTEGACEDGGYCVIGTIEQSEGWLGDPVIRVYFEYTNNGNETESFEGDFSIRAFQDGVSLDTGWADEDVPEEDNLYEEVEPGESITAAEVWELRSDSPVEIEVYDWWNDTTVCGTVYYLN